MIIDAISVGIVLILLAGIAWLWQYTANLQERAGLPPGNVIYTDSGTWFPNQEPLHANDICLTGKPDYLVEQDDGTIVPVELKSGMAPDDPWDGHVYQLAAYCFLVEANYGIRPDYGIVQYQDRAFAIDYTEELEDEMLDILEEMRLDLRAGGVDRSHDDWVVCRSCGMKRSCDQRLDV